MGISAALAILEEIPSCSVTVIAENFSPNTTGDVAGGMWGPFSTADTPSDIINEWSRITWDKMYSWHQSSEASEWGVSLSSGACLGNMATPTPSWSDIPLQYTTLSPSQAAKYSPQFTSGCAFTTLFAEPCLFLPKMMQEITRRGGVFVQKRLQSLGEVAADSDIIINCSGLGARSLVGDKDVIPARGQLVRVHAPWIKTFMCDERPETFAYVLPNINTVSLGGTFDMDNWSTEADPSITDTILARARKLVPSLQKAEVVSVTVGLRPFRKQGPRVQLEEMTFQETTVQVIHNYGHGGSGITMMWGCAMEVVQLVRQVTIS